MPGPSIIILIPRFLARGMIVGRGVSTDISFPDSSQHTLDMVVLRKSRSSVIGMKKNSTRFFISTHSGSRYGKPNGKVAKVLWFFGTKKGILILTPSPGGYTMLLKRSLRPSSTRRRSRCRTYSRVYLNYSSWLVAISLSQFLQGGTLRRVSPFMTKISM